MREWSDGEGATERRAFESCLQCGGHPVYSWAWVFLELRGGDDVDHREECGATATCFAYRESTGTWSAAAADWRSANSLQWTAAFFSAQTARGPRRRRMDGWNASRRCSGTMRRSRRRARSPCGVICDAAAERRRSSGRQGATTTSLHTLTKVTCLVDHRGP